MADYTIDKVSYGGNNYNFDYSRIPFGKVDSTSTSTAFTATVDGITELKDGVCLFLMNGVVTSASGFTININNLGAKPVYQTMAEESRATTLFNKAYTGFLVYNSQRVSGGCWDFYYGYNSNDNTLAYQVRRQNGALLAKQYTGRYQFLFTESEDHLLSTHTTANSTATTKTLTALPFDPFGPIYYYYSTTNVNAEAGYSPSVLYTQFNTCDYRYAFNISASVNSFTANKAIYLKVTPQDNGKVILASTSDPLVQDLPTAEDGYWYIYLGVAYSTYQGTLDATHPVYIYKSGGVRTVTGYSAVVNGVTYTTFTTEVDGLVPGPDSTTVTPSARYTDDYNTSKYWLNAMGNWQIIPSATFNQQGLMDPGQYLAVFVWGKRGFWRLSDTVTIPSGYSWINILTGTIPANDSGKTILYRCTATVLWSANTDTSTYQILGMWHTNEDGTGGSLHDRTAFKVDYDNMDYHREYTYYVTHAPGSPAWQMHLMAQSNRAGSITYRTMAIEGVSWTG